MNIADTLEIDIMSLDAEWAEQSNLYYQASAEASEEFQRLTELKDYLGALSAQVSLDYRTGKRTVKDSEDNPLKVTDKMVEAAVKADKDIEKLNAEIREQKKRYDDAESLVRALDHKKKALENEVSLYLTGYFSEPRDKKVEGAKVPSKNVNDYATDRQRAGLNRKKEDKENTEDEVKPRRRRRRSSEEEDVF